MLGACQLECYLRLVVLSCRCSSLLDQQLMLSMVELVLWFSLVILSTTLTTWSSDLPMMSTLGLRSLFILTFWTCSFPSWGCWGRQTISQSSCVNWVFFIKIIEITLLLLYNTLGSIVMIHYASLVFLCIWVYLGDMKNL